MKKKNYYIIYEIENRDFIPRMLIGLELAKNGNRVFLVSKYFFYKNLNYFPTGMILEKGITNDEEKNYDKILDRGHLLSVIDEEGARYYDNEPKFLSIRISKRTSKKISHFFCWGNKQKKKINHIIKKNISVSGAPKYDLYNIKKIFKDQLAMIKKFKPYILISSNFTFATWEDKDFKEKINSLKKNYKVNHSSYWNNYVKKYKFKKIVLKAFIKDLIRLSKKFKRINFILRPHPNDNQSFWHKKFNKLNNFSVNSKFSIEPWIINCNALINNNCTTTLDGLINKKKVINYSKIKRKGESYFFNKYTHNVKSYESLAKHIRTNYEINSINYKKLITHLKGYINYNPNKNCYKTISENLNSFKFKKEEFSLITKNILSVMFQKDKIINLFRKKSINKKIVNRSPIYYYKVKKNIEKIYPKYTSINFRSINEQLYTFES